MPRQALNAQETEITPLKIVVCFKIVPDLAMLNHNDWQLDNAQRIDTTLVKQEISSADKNALEIALQLADARHTAGQNSQLTALTIADGSAERFLTNLYALGYHQAVRIEPHHADDLRFNPMKVSALLSEYIQQIESPTLIMLGCQSDDGQNGQTAMLLAERLGWPCISQVTGITGHHNSTDLLIESTQGSQILKQQISGPIVVTIAHTVNHASLRIATLKVKLSTAKKTVTVLSSANIIHPMAQPNLQLIGLSPPPAEKSCLFIDGQDAKEKARKLYQQYLTARLTS